MFTMCAPDDLVGLQLPGKPWKVSGRVLREDSSTGGNFSCAYTVAGSDGDEAFLKVFDFSEARDAPDQTEIDGLAALAELHLAYEAIRAREPLGDQLAKAAHVSVERLGVPFIVVVEARLNEMARQHLIEPRTQMEAPAAPRVLPRLDI